MRLHLGRADGVSVGRHCVGGRGQAGICYMRHYPSPQTPLRDMGRGGRATYTVAHMIILFGEGQTIVNKKTFQFLV